MADKLIVFYPHRHNRDGSFDSICLNCFATLATAKTDADLLQFDKSHICLPATVSQQAFDRKLSEKLTPH